MQVDMGYALPYSWRSTLEGCRALKKGFIKRVGDGKTISMWNDPWLSREDNHFPFNLVVEAQVVIPMISIRAYDLFIAIYVCGRGEINLNDV